MQLKKTQQKINVIANFSFSKNINFLLLYIVSLIFQLKLNKNQLSRDLHLRKQHLKFLTQTELLCKLKTCKYFLQEIKALLKYIINL